MWYTFILTGKINAVAFNKTHILLIEHTFCDILTVLSNRYPATGGGEHMEIVISFLVAVAAGVTCHLICKWLDSHNKDNE